MADTRELNDFLIGQFEMFPNFYRPFNNPKKRVRSIKFLPSGDKLVAVTNQRSIELWNCCTASQVNQFNMYKYGISTMDVLDTDETLLIGSHAIKGDYAIRELNMTRKEYTQQFIGHAAPCTSLAVNCEKQYFISVGYDKSMLVFDFRIPDPQISCPNLPSVPLLALHPTTDICALACDNNQIDMMDLRFINGPFCRFKLNTDNVKWTHFKFSPTGEQLLVSSNGSIIRVINSFNGAVQGNYDGRFPFFELTFILTLVNDHFKFHWFQSRSKERAEYPD